MITAAALAAGAILLLVLGTRGGPSVSVTSNVLVTGKGPEAIIDENNSPTVVVNPTQPANVVTVNRVDRPRYSALLHSSLDGGRSWADTPLPLPAGRDRPFAPNAAFSPDGVLYVTYVNLEGLGNDPQTLWLSRSHDGGRTLSAPVKVAGRYSFQGRLTADAGGRVYVTWLQASTVGLLSMNPPAALMAAASTDGGATFSAPVRVSDPGRVRVGAASPVVDPGGGLDVLYQDFKGDARDFLNLAGPPWAGPLALVLTRSTDHGHSFSPGVEVESGVILSERFLVYLPRFPSLAAGPDQSLDVAWADARSGTDQVYVKRSADAGVTWATTTRVSTGVPGTAVSAWLPQVDVAPDGRIDILYLAGHRNAGDGLVAAWLATSADQAATFHSSQLSTSPFDSRIGPLTGPAYLPPDLGTQLSLVSSNSGVVAAWVDSRLGNTDNGRQDIFFATATVSDSDLSPVRIAIIAGMCVLAAGALVAGVADARTSRRRRVTV